MLYKTRGIALSYIKYRETSIIARIFTDSFGIQSYIVNSVRSKTAKTKIALFQPLTILELVVYHNKKKSINRISELKNSFIFQSIPFNIRKTSMALFITEILNQTLIEESENELLFDFVHESILTLDLMPDSFENFHLQFLLQLCKYLGVLPESARSLLKEVGHQKIHDELFAKKIDFFIHSNYQQYQPVGKSTRNEMLTAIIDYYRFHFDSIKEIKSLKVLKEVFH